MYCLLTVDGNPLLSPGTFCLLSFYHDVKILVFPHLSRSFITRSFSGGSRFILGLGLFVELKSDLSGTSLLGQYGTGIKTGCL